MSILILKKTLSVKEEQQMEFRFIQLCQKMKIPEDKIVSYYEKLYQLYNEPNRHYHNLVHIFNFLKLFDAFANQIHSKVLFEIAIWYHDVIYQVKKKDNELQSALLAEELFKEYLDTEEQEFINHLIMSTENHAPRIPHEDVYLFLDFDLAVLATEHEMYEWYSESIWKEYKVAYPWLLYKIGRKKVLKNFLARDKIYFSAFFLENYEKKARQNIQLELNR